MEHENGNCIYTDDSKMDKRVGCGFIQFLGCIKQEYRMFRLGEEITIFMAKVEAIIKALEFIEIQNLKSVKRISGSKSALMTLDSTKETQKIINNIKEKIEELGKVIQLIWIKVHQGFMVMKERTR
ncbi:hypothetical protein AVEN_71451-1 [Araneus ventricosus]|uniref:Uncharacterized protein n=1 Tax=Araneus ventricosus TaxID=182803 RepID=A0A4Y2CV74_ARAVE|nr:hypothetical protein AVEN_71451-1 [Araneus ventricosus]